MAFFVRACFVQKAHHKGTHQRHGKPEIVLIPKLKPHLRPFAAFLRLFDLVQD